MSDVELTDAERDSLNECECGHFLNEHSSEGCLATVYDGDDGQASDDDQCLCVMSPAVWRLRAFEAILAARLSQEREQVRAERDREWRALIEALADRWADDAGIEGYINLGEAEDAIRTLAQDGPRPAQEGERHG